MEVIDIGLNDLETLELNLGDDFNTSSGSSGLGIELLMNDKQKRGNSNSGSMNIDLGELDKLESELNDLSAESSNTKSLSGIGGFSGFSNFFGSSSSSTSQEKPEVSNSKIGQATADSMGNTKTWDGFTKMNEMPSSGPASASSARMTDREKTKKKRMMTKKLEEWYEKGHIKSTSHFTAESSYEDIEDEYESAMEDKRKKDSVKLQGWWFTTFVNSIEYANSAFNPFDINLDGWGEQVSEDLESYEEIFSELHDKYKGGKLSPEISLLLRLGFSAAVVNFTNKALSSATPGFNDVIKQSPELMKMFTNATVSSMSQASPGFGMAANFMNQNQGPSQNMGPPPAPMETKYMPPPQRPSQSQNTMNSRPDLSMGRGAMFREQGIDINQQYQNPYAQEQSIPTPSPNRPEMLGQRPEMLGQRPEMLGQRPEMRGPQNSSIDDILSGLKTRTVDIHQAPPQQQQSREETPYQQFNPTFSATNSNNNTRSDYGDINGDDSMISIASLKDIQNTNMPKKSNRRARGNSAKNTISLDI